MSHNSEGTVNVTWCEGEGCFSLTVDYSVSMDQIDALIAASHTCHQEIKYECKLAPLKNKAYGLKHAWWTDKRGEKKFYFDGDDETKDICNIGENNGICRCDLSLVPLWNYDTGKITNKDSLPIKQFHYGDSLISCRLQKSQLAG